LEILEIGTYLSDHCAGDRGSPRLFCAFRPWTKQKIKRRSVTRTYKFLPHAGHFPSYMTTVEHDSHPPEQLAKILTEVGISPVRMSLIIVSTSCRIPQLLPTWQNVFNTLIQHETVQILTTPESVRTLESFNTFLEYYSDVCAAERSKENVVMTPSTDMDAPLETPKLHAPILRGKHSYLSPSYTHPGSVLLSPFSPLTTSFARGIYSDLGELSTPTDQNTRSRFAEYFEHSGSTIWNDIQSELAPIYTGVSPTASCYSSEEPTEHELQQREKTVSQQLLSFKFDCEKQKETKYSRIKRLWVPALNLDTSSSSALAQTDQTQPIEPMGSQEEASQIIPPLSIDHVVEESDDQKGKATMSADQGREGDGDSARKVGRRRRGNRRKKASSASESSSSSG